MAKLTASRVNAPSTRCMLRLNDARSFVETSYSQASKFFVLDFAGQQLYYTFHHLFISPRAIYAVVFRLDCLMQPEERPKQIAYIVYELTRRYPRACIQSASSLHPVCIQ